MKRRQAVSLAETIVALFLLTGVVLVLVTLLHTLLRYGHRVEMQSLAALAAEKRIEQIRDWARKKPGAIYNFENLVSNYAGTVTTDPQFPGLQLTTQARWQPLDLDGSSFEQPEVDKNRLNSSAVLVQVSAVWVAGGGGHSVVVTSLIAAPARLPNSTLTITQVNGGNPITGLGSGVFRASAKDSGNQPLPDLSYRWYITPQTGNASVSLNRRDTSEAKVTNQVRHADGSFGPTSGTCRLEARAIYRGQELTGTFSVSLAP